MCLNMPFSSRPIRAAGNKKAAKANQAAFWETPKQRVETEN